ncbi:MAG: nucleotidyltransferase family protein [Christensenellales bacterium]
MNEWKKTLINPDTQIYKVIEIIDRNSGQIAIVADEEGKLLGTVTDGDIRRGILKGIPLNNPVSQIMNLHPVTIPKMNDPKSVIDILKANKIRHLPVIDEGRHVVGVERLDERLTDSHKKNWIVIMAGGRGKRLKPLTDDCPKPMLKIGGKPMLQIILEQLIRQGFARFCISVNYKSTQIKDYFGDGSKFGAKICYIDEKKRMGTAGSLSLFPFETQEPILVLNGDILTKLSFEQLVDFHKERQAKATIAVAAYGFQVPYGLIKAKHDFLVGFEEKPVFSSFINAGIYVFNPQAVDYVPKDSYFDMNDLFKALIRNKEPVCIFPIREYWTDIGEIKSFNQACKDYANETH